MPWWVIDDDIPYPNTAYISLKRYAPSKPGVSDIVHQYNQKVLVFGVKGWFPDEVKK